MKYIGRQIEVGIGKETTRGTTAGAFSWYPKTSFDFDDKIETTENESSLGVKLDASEIEVTKRYGMGSLEIPVRANDFGTILSGMLGDVTTTEEITGAVWSHIFKIDNDSQTPSLSIATKEANGDMAYPLALIEELTLSATVGERIIANVTFKSKAGETATHTSTYPTDYEFRAVHSTFKKAADVANIDLSAAACVESFEITFTKESIDLYCLNSGNEPNDILDGKIGISGSITAVYDDVASYKDPAMNSTNQTLLFSLEDTTKLLNNEVGEHPSVEFLLPTVKYTDYTRDMSNDSIVRQTLNFKAYQPDSSQEAIEVTLKNTQNAY